MLLKVEFNSVKRTELKVCCCYSVQSPMELLGYIGVAGVWVIRTYCVLLCTRIFWFCSRW